MTRELAIRPLTPDIWRMIESIAPVLYKSRLFGVTSPEAAAAIALKGYELGLGIAASFELIQVIQGKPTLSPRGALALILQSGLLDGIKIDDQADRCTVWMKRKGGLEYQLTYKIDDAQKAGLVKPDSAWEKFGQNMLRWRAIGFVADVLFPDVLGGLKRADEFGADIDSNGNVVDGEWQVQEPPSPNGNKPTLADLINQYGAEAIMQANDGKVPASDEELAAVASRLADDRPEAEIGSA